jgi:hypothetical protein
MKLTQLLPGYDIALLDKGRVEWRFAFTRPTLQLGELVNEEDASPLRFATGLHDPCALWILPILLHKHVIVCMMSNVLFHLQNSLRI